MTKLFYSYFDKLADKNICCCSFYGLVFDMRTKTVAMVTNSWKMNKAKLHLHKQTKNTMTLVH